MRAWLSQTLFQSVLIVASILLALAFDEWREEREEDELVARALYSFKLEVAQNVTRLEDFIPFHEGLYKFFQRQYLTGQITDVAGLNEIMQGFEPAILENTAWDTAVATGALAEMDYDMASALSLTYSVQARFANEHQQNLEDIENRVPLANDDVGFLSLQALKRFQKVTESAVELNVIYQQVGALLEPVEPPED